MALIFHQNMRTFSGGARTAAYQLAMLTIRGVTGANYWAAGFTEIMSNSANLRLNLAAIAQTLDPGLTDQIVIEIGLTAVGRKREFIGIAWDDGNGITVEHAGQVLRDSMWMAWTAFNRPRGAGLPAVINMPPGVMLAADLRGLAYIAGYRGADRYILAFMHNMYQLLPPTMGFRSLYAMANQIRVAIGGAYAGAEVIIGGDFNLRPNAARRAMRGNPRLYTCATLVAPPPAPAVYVNTTASNPYDFFVVSNNALDDGDVDMYAFTRALGMSDHAGVVLTR
jgi:hypothetical protein